MALSTMYEGKNNSPQTDITSAITASDMVIPVTDISVFPAAPNLATIGTDENAEVIRYNGIEGSTLTGCERGFGGTTASSWPASTVISRQITKYDLDTLRGNILDLEARKLEALDDAPTAGSSNPVKSSGIKIALDEKQNALTFDNTPTANSSNPVKSSGIKTALDAKTNLSNGVLYFQNQATSATSSSAVFCTISDTRITTKHVVTEVYFSIPSAVRTNVTWNTNTAGRVTLSGINTNANNKVYVTLALAGNL